VAAQVFDRYQEAPIQAETTLAEKFLRVTSLRAVTLVIDPLGLVKISGGKPQIDSAHKALVSIRDYVERSGAVDGKHLSEIFTDPPFGWSPDTLRYLVAALLLDGQIKLKVSGREVTVNGQQAIDALRTNQSFKTVGVALRDSRPSNQVLARAADRAGEITGETVLPLEDEISKAVTRCFPQLQLRYGGLDTRLDALELPGGDVVRALKQELADLLQTDGSDAPQRLGAERSVLYERLRWAGEADRALANGLEGTVREIQRYRQAIAALPAGGVPGQLRDDLAGELEVVARRLSGAGFAAQAADLRSALTGIKARVVNAVAQLAGAQTELIREAQQELQRVGGWSELTQEEQAPLLARIEALQIDAPSDLPGLQQLLNQQLTLASLGRDLRRQVDQLAGERRRAREEEERRWAQEAQGAEKATGVRETGPLVEHHVKLPARITSAVGLDAMIAKLQQIRDGLPAYPGKVEVTIELEG
jgi:hypothetical protein